MQPDIQVLLAFLFAHILGDFPLQTRRMVAGKVAFQVTSYASHGLVHLILAMAALTLFTHIPLWQPSALGAVAFLTAGHLLLDLGKSTLIRWRSELDRLPLFIADQVLHVVIVVAAALIVVRPLPAGDWIWDAWLQERDRILVTAVILGASVFPAGYLIRYLLIPLSKELAGAGQAGESSRELTELSNAGLYLGWLERALLVIAFAAGSSAAVALIIAAKSVARFPEFKSRAFAEYFLIGTLASVTVAAAGGWILREALAGLAV